MPAEHPMADQDLNGPGLLKIGAFARLAGTNLRTLRYYEEIGLLRPASRSKGGFRYYRPTDVNRLAMVQRMQELGLPLERIRQLLHTRWAASSRRELITRVRGALAEQDQLLEERMQSIRSQRQRIAEALTKLNECEHCGYEPGPGNNYCEPCPVDGESLPEDLSALY